jgi:hypothetical protein
MSMKHGSLVGWERFRNPKIHRSLVEQSLAKHGLPTEVVHDLTPKAAFGRRVPVPAHQEGSPG